MTRGGGRDGFTSEDRKSLNALLKYVKTIDQTIKKLKDNVKNYHHIIANQNAVIMNQNAAINKLRSEMNCINYRVDAQQQYNRRESARGLGVSDLGDDALQIMKDVCKLIEDKAPEYEGEKLTINLQASDIHRCHFIGRGDKKKLICKFTPAAYHKKMKLMLNKKYVNQITTGRFKDFFLVEDLTPMRSHLLWFIKNNYSNKYHKVHTRNGVIKMKKKEDDSNKGNWISVENPDDLHALVGDDAFDVEAFNTGLISFKVLSDIPAPVFGDLPCDEDEEDEEECVLPHEI